MIHSSSLHLLRCDLIEFPTTYCHGGNPYTPSLVGSAFLQFEQPAVVRIYLQSDTQIFFRLSVFEHVTRPHHEIGIYIRVLAELPGKIKSMNIDAVVSGMGC